MITDSQGRLIEIRGYDGEFAHTLFYVFQNGVDSWLATFRSARLHDTVPVIMSTGRRAYFENQLRRHGFTTINGQIPTPIISFWLNDFQRVKALDHPREIKWYSDTEPGCYYPDMIPFEGSWTVSFWTHKQADMWELDGQFQRSFNNGGLRWIVFKDEITGRFQFCRFEIENRSDATNYEPGDTDQPLLRVDYNLKCDLWLPFEGNTVSQIKKIYLDVNFGQPSISYISGVIVEQGAQENNGTLQGILSPGMIYFSGVVNSGEADTETVVENHQWGENPFL